MELLLTSLRWGISCNIVKLTPYMEVHGCESFSKCSRASFHWGGTRITTHLGMQNRPKRPAIGLSCPCRIEVKMAVVDKGSFVALVGGFTRRFRDSDDF